MNLFGQHINNDVERQHFQTYFLTNVSKHHKGLIFQWLYQHQIDSKQKKYDKLSLELKTKFQYEQWEIDINDYHYYPYLSIFLQNSCFQQIYKTFGEQVIDILLNQVNIYIKQKYKYILVSGQTSSLTQDTNNIIYTQCNLFYLTNIFKYSNCHHFFPNILKNNKLKHQFQFILSQMQNNQYFQKLDALLIFNKQDQLYSQKLSEYTNSQVNAQECISISDDDSISVEPISEKAPNSIKQKIFFDINDLYLLVKQLLLDMKVHLYLNALNFNRFMNNFKNNYLSLNKNEFVSLQTLISGVQINQIFQSNNQQQSQTKNNDKELKMREQSYILQIKQKQKITNQHTKKVTKEKQQIQKQIQKDDITFTQYVDKHKKPAHSQTQISTEGVKDQINNTQKIKQNKFNKHQIILDYISDLMKIIEFFLSRFIFIIDSHSAINRSKIVFVNKFYIQHINQIVYQQFKFQNQLIISYNNYIVNGGSKDIRQYRKFIFNNYDFVGQMNYVVKNKDILQFRPILNANYKINQIGGQQKSYNQQCFNICQFLNNFIMIQYNVNFKQVVQEITNLHLQQCDSQQKTNQQLKQNFQIFDIEAAYDKIDQYMLFQLIANIIDINNHKVSSFEFMQYQEKNIITADTQSKTNGQILQHTQKVYFPDKICTVPRGEIFQKLKSIIFDSYFIFNNDLYQYKTGVPQGSILSPLFCYVYYNYIINQIVFKFIYQEHIISQQILTAEQQLKQNIENMRNNVTNNQVQNISQQTEIQFSLYVYVDDIIVVATDQKLIQKFKDELSQIIKITDETDWCNFDIENRTNLFKFVDNFQCNQEKYRQKLQLQNLKNTIQYSFNKRFSFPNFYLNTSNNKIYNKLRFYKNRVLNSLQINITQIQFAKQIFNLNDIFVQLLGLCKQKKFQKLWLKYKYFEIILDLIRIANRKYVLDIDQFRKLKYVVFQDLVRQNIIDQCPQMQKFVKSYIHKFESQNQVNTAANISK